MRLTLVPAYGRDYKSAKEVKEAWAGGKDFLIMDYSSPHDGRYVNQDNDMPKGTIFNIRYKRMTNICQIKKRG